MSFGIGDSFITEISVALYPTQCPKDTQGKDRAYFLTRRVTMIWVEVGKPFSRSFIVCPVLPS